MQSRCAGEARNRELLAHSNLRAKRTELERYRETVFAIVAVKVDEDSLKLSDVIENILFRG
jgi:16S rRNA G966 N2-methylase RsmD